MFAFTIILPVVMSLIIFTLVATWYVIILTTQGNKFPKINEISSRSRNITKTR